MLPDTAPAEGTHFSTTLLLTGFGQWSVSGTWKPDSSDLPFYFRLCEVKHGTRLRIKKAHASC